MAKRKKLTKAQQNQIDLENEQQLQAFDNFYNKFNGLVFKAEVRWFDHLSGVGNIQGLNGEGSWTLYACNIPGAKTWFAESACVSHTEGQMIDAEVKPSYGCSLAISHTPGDFDAEKWANFDQNNSGLKNYRKWQAN